MERPWVEIRTKAAPITSVLRTLREQSGRELHFDEDLPGTVVVSLHAPWDVLRARYELSVEERLGLRVVAKDPSAGRSSHQLPESWPAGGYLADE